MVRILIVDDDTALAGTIRDHCTSRGHDVTLVDQAARCLPELDSVSPDLVFLDVRLRDGNGLELLRRIKSRRGDVPVAIMTGFEPMSSASSAGAGGAEFFIRKPFGTEEIDGVLDVIEREGPTVEEGEGATATSIPGVRFVGVSRAMIEVCRSIGLAARSGATTLIEGESGVGKELAARAIHSLAGAERPFTVVDCSALVETLFESELFGHERGAFTGAVMTRPGKIEVARGGLLFLDEVGELTPRMQAKFLRFLQERTFERVGSNLPIRVECQTVAATNRSLERMAQEGGFRSDLLYRLDVLHINIPPLRERREDIPPLVRHLLREIGPRGARRRPEISPGALDVLVSHDWPGNVRQLENVLLRCVVHSGGETLTADVIRRWLKGGPAGVAPRTLDALEREAVASAVEFSRGNLGKACKLLGVSRPTLRRKMRRYRIMP